jgi:hypothetical protein
MRKKGFAAILLTFVLVFAQIGVYANSIVSVAFNGAAVEFTGVQPIIMENEILVPVEFFEKLGFETTQFDSAFSGPLWIDEEIYRNFDEGHILTAAILTIDYVEFIAHDGVSVLPVNHWALMNYVTAQTLNPGLQLSSDSVNYLGLGTNYLHVDVTPRVVDGTMMLPLLPIVEAVGFEVRWSDAWAIRLTRRQYPELEGSDKMMTLDELTEANLFSLSYNNLRLFWNEDERKLEAKLNVSY